MNSKLNKQSNKELHLLAEKNDGKMGKSRGNKVTHTLLE